MLRKVTRDPRFTRALTIVTPIAVAVWFFGGAPVAAAGFFALGTVYGVVLFRVVSRSGRASMVGEEGRIRHQAQAGAHR